LRIGLAALTLADLVQRAVDLGAFYTDTGVLPRAMLEGTFPLRFFWGGSVGAAAAHFALAVLAAVALGLGWYTRAASVATWLLVSSIQARNPEIAGGGDTVLRVLLFWGMWSDWGAAYSCDARHAGGRRRAASLPVVALQGQIVLLYAAAAISKSGAAWLDGSAVLDSVRTELFVRPPLGSLLADQPNLARALSWATIAIEGAFPLLVVSGNRRARAAALGLGLALHLGIFATLRVGLFSLVLPVSYLVLVPPTWLDALERRFGLPPAPQRADEPGGGARTLAVLFHFVLVVCSLVAERSTGYEPRWLARYLTLTGLHQRWRMFAAPPEQDVRWAAAGRDATNAPVDALAPLPAFTRARFTDDRWLRYRGHLQRGGEERLRRFGAYLCRLGRSRSLASFDLVARIRRVDDRDGPFAEHLIMRQRCR
jgi:hypothetical protein